MSTVSASSEALRAVLWQPTGDIVGLVDDLLKVCGERGLQLDWHAGRLRVRSFAGAWQELGDVPLRKSAFRAVLARFAVLCNERRPGSCSPYGGQGEIVVGNHPATVLRVDFTNTPDEQRLRLTHGGTAMSTSPVPEVEGHPLLAALLDEVPRLQKDLGGWWPTHLVPALDAFPDQPSDAQLVTALADLRTVLLRRADVDPWLGDIARLGSEQDAGGPRMTSPAEYRERQEPPTPPIKNRTVVEQARKLAEALKTPPPPSGPGKK